MSLKDFMQQLQEQDNDVIYSKPPEESIQIIPPSKVDKARNLDSIKVIPPKEETPKVIRFKLNLNTQEQSNLSSQVVNQPSTNTTQPDRKTPEVIIPKKTTQEQPRRPVQDESMSVSQPMRQQPRVEQPVNRQPSPSIDNRQQQNRPQQVSRSQQPVENRRPVENTVRQSPTPPKMDKGEELFIRSETPLSKKEIWFEYYNKALKSNKTNFVTDKCRRGRFMINEENKFIVLSDYDTYDKDANEILRDSWF